MKMLRRAVVSRTHRDFFSLMRVYAFAKNRVRGTLWW